MYLLYCDETNLEERENDFFVYGGIAIPANNALSLSHEINDIRTRSGIAREYLLKFNPSPENLSHQEFIPVKQSIIEATVYD